jgi:hypothetical protein
MTLRALGDIEELKEASLKLAIEGRKHSEVRALPDNTREKYANLNFRNYRRCWKRGYLLRNRATATSRT